MESENLPADWAIERALELVNNISMPFALHTKPEVAGSSVGQALARYIEAHEEPPVDRKLQCAREAVAQVLELEGSNTLAATVRAGGEYDEKPGVLCCLKFHELWEQGFAK